MEGRLKSQSCEKHHSWYEHRPSRAQLVPFGDLDISQVGRALNASRAFSHLMQRVSADTNQLSVTDLEF